MFGTRHRRRAHRGARPFARGFVPPDGINGAIVPGGGGIVPPGGGFGPDGGSGGGPPPPSPSDRGSARFTSNTSGAELLYNLGAQGHADFVLVALVYFEGNQSNSYYLGIRNVGNGRSVLIQNNNSFPAYPFALGDTDTGNTVFASQPPLNTWLRVTIQGTTVAGGDSLRATWTEIEDPEGAINAVTRANGIPNTVQATGVFVGGDASSGQAAQPASRYQYVRGRTGYLDDATLDALRNETDASGGPWEFWWDFRDDGEGGLTVVDLTGNGRVPTITGGTFATGPVLLPAS